MTPEERRLLNAMATNLIVYNVVVILLGVLWLLGAGR